MTLLLKAILIVGGLCAFIGSVLFLLARRVKSKDNELVDQINELLPQTQCGQCEFPGCRPYATAIATNQADINSCPPGGKTTIKKLADLLGREVKPLSAEVPANKLKQVAAIVTIKTTMRRNSKLYGCNK